MRELMKSGVFANRHGYVPTGFVLRHSRTNPMPFIVHRYMVHESGNVSYDSGGYYLNVAEAMDDFNTRVDRALRNGERFNID